MRHLVRMEGEESCGYGEKSSEAMWLARKTVSYGGAHMRTWGWPSPARVVWGEGEMGQYGRGSNFSHLRSRKKVLQKGEGIK